MANNLSEYRSRSGLSRTKLAARAGIDPQTIYKLENGTVPQLSTAQALARALGELLGEAIRVEDLFPSEEVPA